MDVSEILTELNEHGFEDTTTARKTSIINDTIEDVCSREPWPFLEKELSLTFDGTNPYPSNWPTDFSKLIGLHNPSGAPLGWERWEVVRKRFATSLTQSGTPMMFYFKAGRLNTYPIPGVSETLDMEYLRWHPEITESSVEADILIPSRHHRVLVLGTLVKLYAMEDDPELSALFNEQYEGRIALMREDVIRVSYESTDRIFTFEDDWNDPYYI